MSSVHREHLAELCERALARAGVHPSDARTLAGATVEAELVGNRAVGVSHLFDYLDGFAQGRIAKQSQPQMQRAAPAVVAVDASRGLAQVAFTAGFDELQRAVQDCGVAAMWIKNAFTCGELGYYPRRLAERGFLAFAVANSPALMSLGGAPTAVLGTNPLAYGVPRPGRSPVVIDQASSSTAFVNIRRAAESGETIPAGWALGPNGDHTQDPHAALQGALLPFGSHRGGNIALLVEVLATLSGASFSLDAPPFHTGTRSPTIGVFLLAIDPAIFSGSVDRLVTHLELLRDEHEVRLPALELTALPDSVDVDSESFHRLRQAAGD